MLYLNLELYIIIIYVPPLLYIYIYIYSISISYLSFSVIHLNIAKVALIQHVWAKSFETSGGLKKNNHPKDLLLTKLAIGYATTTYDLLVF